MQELYIYNTAQRDLIPFIPRTNSKEVLLYHCGPTVYNYAHIGNMRAYVFADTLRRALEWNGYTTKQVINITDVGHLVSDADEGEDKIEVGAKRDGTNVETIIQKYTEAFLSDSDALNIRRAHDYPRATKHISEQIALIRVLEQKGYTYLTRDGVYFDTSKFSHYPDFARLDLTGLSAGERVDIGEKRHSTDFALWKLNTSGEHRLQEWDSPWGVGFPGWHIECSAMSMKCLDSETIDIHTGGIDHIPVHHTNEIAQSECATEKPFARYWMHVAFMNVDGQKMSKSLGNTYRVTELQDKFEISPLGYRYWLLTSHYRTQVNFTAEAVRAAETALIRLRKKVAELPSGTSPKQEYIDAVTEFINKDLNTSGVLALLHTFLSTGSDIDKATIAKIDELLGLGLLISCDEELTSFEIPEDIVRLSEERRIAKIAKNWNRADEIRIRIASRGFTLEDTKDGHTIIRPA